MSTLAAPPEGLTIPETRQLTAPIDQIEFREDDDKLVFVGHAAVFDRLSEDLGGFRERIQRGAFRKVLDADPDVRFLINHTGLPLARTKNRTLELREDPKGLRVYAELAPTQAAKDLRVLVKRSDVDQMSFGFSMFNDAGERVGKDIWEEGPDGIIRTIVEFGGLFDVSPVTFPAYRHTDASMRALVCGVEIITSGQVEEDRLRDLAWRVHRGEQDATVEERAAIDAAFSKTETISPWMAEHALRAVAQEPELQAAIPGQTVKVTFEDSPSGQTVPYRLAARKRRLGMTRA